MFVSDRGGDAAARQPGDLPARLLRHLHAVPALPVRGGGLQGLRRGGLPVELTWDATGGVAGRHVTKIKRHFLECRGLELAKGAPVPGHCPPHLLYLLPCCHIFIFICLFNYQVIHDSQ